MTRTDFTETTVLRGFGLMVKRNGSVMDSDTVTETFPPLSTVMTFALNGGSPRGFIEKETNQPS